MDISNEKLTAEFDDSFDGDEKASMFLKLTSSAFTLTKERIKISQIGISEPKKKSRVKSLIGLSKSISELGVVVPIHVMTVSEDVEDDDYKYFLLDGLRRMYGALRNNLEEIDAIVWDFKDKDKGSEVALFLSFLLNRNERFGWEETWDVYKSLELSYEITPGTLEYLLQLKSGDAMKLKDVMLCGYEEEVIQPLKNGEKDLDGAYKILQKLRKEENRLAQEDMTGVVDAVEEASGLAGDEGEAEKPIPELSDEKAQEILGMLDSDMGDPDSDDFNELNKGDSDFVEQQVVGERHPLDPALKQAVLARDDFKCSCCGFGGPYSLGVMAVHHMLPVHTGGKDVMENLTTLCLNHHILVHIAERNGGKLNMRKEEFDAMSPDNQGAMRKVLKLAKMAVLADKAKGYSKEEVAKFTADAIRHPMPGTGLKEMTEMYKKYESEKGAPSDDDSEEEAS